MPLKSPQLVIAIEYQEKLYGALSSVSDTVQENLDKMRFECKNALYECENLSSQVKEAEDNHQRILSKSSQWDNDQKGRLFQIRHC